MNSIALRFCVGSCLALASMAAVAAPAPAAFEGVFDLRDAQVTGDDAVTLTLLFRIVNRGSTAVDGCVLLLEDPFEPSRSLGAVPGISVESMGTVAVEARLTVPRREYEHWMRGGAPRAFLAVAMDAPTSPDSDSQDGASAVVDIRRTTDPPPPENWSLVGQVVLRRDLRAFEAMP